VACGSEVRLPCTWEQIRQAQEIGRGGLSCGAQFVCTDSSTLSAQQKTIYSEGRAGRLCLRWGWGSASQPQRREWWS